MEREREREKVPPNANKKSDKRGKFLYYILCIDPVLI